MFKFLSWEEGATRSRNNPTTTKWVKRKKIRSRSRDGPRDQLYAAMPPLETKKALFANGAGTCRARRIQGEDAVKLKFVDVKEAHQNQNVELADEFSAHGKNARLRKWIDGIRKAASAWEDDYLRVGFRRVHERQSSANVLPPCDRRE